jgi:hypothetical protein
MSWAIVSPVLLLMRVSRPSEAVLPQGTKEMEIMDISFGDGFLCLVDSLYIRRDTASRHSKKTRFF